MPITSKPFSLIFSIKTPLSDPPCSAEFTLETMKTLHIILLVSPPLCRSNRVMGDKKLCYRYFRRFTNSFRLPRAILHVSEYLLCVYSIPLCNLTRYIFQYFCCSLLNDPGRYLRKFNRSPITGNLGYSSLKLLTSHIKQKVTLPSYQIISKNYLSLQFNSVTTFY